MSTRGIIGIVSFCLAVTGLFLANMFLIMMIGEINRKRQEGNLISYFGFAFPKVVRVFEEYRREYPGGKLYAYVLAAFSLAVVGLISVAVCLHIIG
jgi:hypothetical protein